MQKIIFALISLFVIISAVKVPSDGKVILTRVQNNNGQSFYTAPAYLDYNTTSKQAQSAVSMLVALYSNQAVVGTNTTGLQDYNATAHDANVTASTGKALFVNNIIPGNYTTVNVALDSANWNLTINAIYATNVAVANYVDYNGTGASGILGLGYNTTSLNNYGKKVPTLSVSLSQDLKNGTLLFGTDDSKTANLNSAVKFPTQSNWQVANVTSVAIGTATFTAPTNTNNTYSVAFDLNTEDLTLPKTIYNTVITGLGDSSLNCDTTSIYRPVCNITGNLTVLPDITITVGENSLIIPPSAYVVDAASYNATLGGNVTLAIKLSDASNDSVNTHVTASFNRNIIIGSQLLSFYYAEFTGTRSSTSAGTVELFQAGEVPQPTPTPTPTPSGGSKWWIVLVILAVVLVGAGIYWFVARRNKANRLEEDINGNLLRA